jgi:hypothetical protein
MANPQRVISKNVMCVPLDNGKGGSVVIPLLMLLSKGTSYKIKAGEDKERGRGRDGTGHCHACLKHPRRLPGSSRTWQIKCGHGRRGQGEYRLGETQHLLCSAPNQGFARPAQVWQSQEAAGVRALGHKESLLWVD